MQINWKTRIKNRSFWLAAIPATLLVIQTVAAPFGYQWDFVVLNQQLALIVNAVFSLLMLIGVVNDPNTDGFGDSNRAMGYEKPWLDSYADQREWSE